MAKVKEESKMVPFCTKLTEANKKGLRKYAADRDQRLYEAINEVIKKGLQR
jgi:hypothetical protein